MLKRIAKQKLMQPYEFTSSRALEHSSTELFNVTTSSLTTRSLNVSVIILSEHFPFPAEHFLRTRNVILF